MKKGEKFIAGLMLAVLLNVIVFVFDKEIVRFVVGLRNLLIYGPVDYFFVIIGLLSNIIIIFLFLTTLFLWKKKKNWFAALCSSILLSGMAGFLIKIWLQRPRPFQAGVVPLISVSFYEFIGGFSSWNFSFPSMHTLLVFSVMPLVNKHFKKFRYYWLIFACLTGFSRVYFGMHYFSDVIAGAIIGVFAGYITLLLAKKYKKNETF
jgi:undecaprenyl-diphosphatase